MHKSALLKFAPEPLPPSDTVSLGPLTLSRTTYGLGTHVVAAAFTILVALILLRLVPVLERFVLRRAAKAEASPDESAAEVRQRVETLTKVTGSVARGLIWTVTI